MTTAAAERTFSTLWKLKNYLKSLHGQRLTNYDNSNEYNSIMTFAILYLLNTVPSVDSSIPVTIQPVVTHNMLNITMFVNVRKSFLHSYYSVFITFAYSPKEALLC